MPAGGGGLTDEEAEAATAEPPATAALVLADRRVRESTFHQEFGQGATG